MKNLLGRTRVGSARAGGLFAAVSIVTVLWASPAARAQGPLYFRPFVSYPIASYSFDVAVADFNGDGTLDAATANYYTDNVSILLGNGDGTFQSAVNYAAGGGSPMNIEVGYFNADSTPDLALVNRGPGGSCTSFVSVLLGNGDGTFQGAVTYPIGPCPWEMAVGYLNGDPYADLAVVNTADSTVSVLLGNGDGTFQPAVNYPASGNSYAVAVGDFNADGARDLAVSNLFGPLSVLLGNGDGTFQPQVLYSAGNGGHRVTAGLFNADTKPDLAVFNIFDNAVAILLGNGDGTFQAPISYALANTPVGNAVADFNSDGKLDIAVTDYQTNQFSILLGNGDGTFHAGGDFCVGDLVYGIRAGDFNADGRLDLVTSHETGNVSVRLATPLVSPACGSTPPPVLAFGLEHQPLNGANLQFDLDGNLVVTPGAGPGAGDEDVSVNIGDGAGLTCAPAPTSDLTQLGQRLRSTLRGTVSGVPDTVVAVSNIEGTGSSALLSVDFPLGAAEGQRVSVYDDRNRLIDCIVVPNASPFTLTASQRGATITKSTSNVKNNLVAPQPEHTDEFSVDMDVTTPAAPGQTWHDVRKITAQSLKKQGDPIRSVDVNFGKKPSGSSLVIQQEGAGLLIPGSPASQASFSTTGLSVITPVPDAVVLTEPPGGGGGVFAIADRGVPGELRRGKKRAEVEVETPAVGPLADGSYLKTTAHLLVKNKLCPPECYPVSVTQKKVAGPLPVEISADFTALGSTTHRVTVKREGVVLGVHEGVGPVVGHSLIIQWTNDFGPSTPITRGPNHPVKGISVGLNKSPGSVTQVSGTTYDDADEIIIEPEFPNVTIEAIDDLQLETHGLGSITVTSATFEDTALLVGGLPVSAAGPEAQVDLDTNNQLAVYHIGGTGQDGCTVDLSSLSAATPGYTTQVPRLPGGTSQARYDVDVTTGPGITIQVFDNGDAVTVEPITPGGTYDLYVYKKGLKVYSATGQSGPALVLTGGTKPVPMQLYTEDIGDETHIVLELSVGGDYGTASTGCCIGGTGQDGIRIICPVNPGAVLKKLDCRLTTDRPDAVYRTDHALLDPAYRTPIAGLGEAQIEMIDGLLAATGLTDSGYDGAGYRAINEKGIQTADVGWLQPAASAAAGSSITTTGSFAALLDPTTTYPAKKRDRKRPDSRFDVTADFTALGSSTVHIEVLSQGVLVAELPGHGPDIGIAGSAPIGAGAGTVWRLGGEGACVSSTYPAGTTFVIDGQTYSGDQLVLGGESRAATQQLMGLSVTTVGYERLVFGDFSFEPIPVCLADLNDDTFVDFADYLEFLNFYDMQSPYVDFNQDGFVDFLDYLEFLNLFDAGC
ncbi:MAG: VCBS repeat-containing protein [Phycisphaerales bacterium]|nr:VCBS repeat-containing protein [Phycisphaerales bacterium]